MEFALMAFRRDATVANLMRTARQLVADKTAREDALLRVAQISTDPAELGIAAGRSLGRWQALPFFNQWDEEAAQLLVRAGADKEVMQATADETVRRLRKYMRLG
ncbi:hypothetical protein H5V45_09300 [Nocardioides sp. KIGAM211]|uniref:Uncharacterized protein n=1 Tax=Nocardioides luti TaxID=2761101 RepID=A0A7X0RI60_9ACTN|nr:hypothetical protein [Nocardioides luti]MBB6627518.1 hypothetical protein [Nocardioides luti]